MARVGLRPDRCFTRWMDMMIGTKGMTNPYTAWASAGLDAWTLGVDASAVIGLRLAKIAAGDAEAGREARLMVAEKVEAAFELQAEMMAGRFGQTPLSGTQSLLSHYGRKVRANKRRLS